MSGQPPVTLCRGEPLPTPDALQRRFDALLRYTRGILFEMDARGTYRYVRAAEPALLARPEGELLGRTVTEVLGDNDGLPFIDLVQRVLGSGREETYEYVLNVQDGPRAFVADAIPIAANPDSITLLVRDVTEEKELKAKLVDAERLASIGLLAAAVGHEINNPLAFIANIISALESGREADLPAALSQLRDATRRISAIVGSLRLLGPATAHEPVTTVDLTHPLQAALELTRLRIQDRARLSVTTVSPVYVRGIEGKLCQVFVNVLMNAVQAIIPGAPQANSVTVNLDVEGGWVAVRITDTGGGIDEGARDKLFTPFFTTRHTEHGTGLGLYVTRTIIDAHGGHIELDSEVGRGTTVTISLQLTAPPPRTASPPPPAAIEVRPERARLLAIDDKRTFLVSLRLALKPFADVVTCETAEEALRLLAAETAPFDLILCDLMMPGVDGISFHDRLGGHRPDLLSKLVFTTGGAYTDRARNFLETVRPRVLPKPFFPEQVLRLLPKV